MIGITPIMDWARKHYDKDYAPNTRETVRRHSMHQFVQAGIAVYNPDNPSRPVNSLWRHRRQIWILRCGFSGRAWHCIGQPRQAPRCGSLVRGVQLDLLDRICDQSRTGGLQVPHGTTRKALQNLPAGRVYVSAFPNRKLFMKYL